MRTCTRCSTTKPLTEFAVSKRGPTKTQSHCKVCAASMSAAFRAANKGNPEYRAQVYAWNQKWASKNRAHVCSLSSAWRKANPEYTRAQWQQRRAAKLQRTPPWFGEFDDLVMREAADLAVRRQAIAGFDWHVDHVFPLQGKRVSGLHVGVNIAVIPGSVNCSKSNHF